MQRTRVGASAAYRPPEHRFTKPLGQASILANDFVTTNVIADVLGGCNVADLEITTNLNTEVRDIQVAALKSEPAAYSGVITANGSVVPLLVAAPYPILPWMSLMNVALGAELVEFFQGREDARTALSDVEASYRTQAKSEGYLEAAR